MRAAAVSSQWVQLPTYIRDFFWSLGTQFVHMGRCIFCISLPLLLHPVCCVAISAFRNALRRSLLPANRYTAIFCYNSPSWRQPQQLRQRLTPLRHFQSSGAFTRSASTASSAPIARLAVVPAYASTASSAPFARCAVAPVYVSMASSAPFVRRAAAPAYVGTASIATDARRVAAPVYAPTTKIATVVLSA